MACLTNILLEKETKKAENRWIDSKAIEKWGLTDDDGAYGKLFEAATGKEFLAGIGINEKDMAKFNVAIEDFIVDLKTPGILSNKVIRNMYVGQALSMRNPFTKDFFNELVKSNNYRNSHSQKMMSSYKDMVKHLKLAMLEFQHVDTANLTADAKTRLRDYVPTPGKAENRKIIEDTIEKLNVMEKKYYVAKEEGGDAVSEMINIHEFLEKEGSVFQDFIERVTNQDDSMLIKKYASAEDSGRIKQSKKAYANRLSAASSSWRKVQDYAKNHLVKSITGLNEIIELKYGKTSRTAKYLTEQYASIAKKLEEHEGGYVPHYVLDILKHSMELPEKMATTESSVERDNIINSYVKEANEINTGLTHRLKEKGGESMEYFSRNPMLYANKYIEQVTQFNHSTRINLAYTKGLKKLSEVAFRNAGEAEGNAAKVYSDILTDLYTRSVGGRTIDDAPQAENIVRLLSSMQFISKLGFSTRGALRNATQRLLNYMYFGNLQQYDATVAKRTNDPYRKAMEAELDKHGLKFVDVSQVTEGAVTAADLKASGIEYEKGMFSVRDKETFIEMLTKKGQSLAEASSVFTKWAENANRRATFNVAFHQRFEQLKKSDRYSNWEGNTEAGKEKLDRLYKKSGNFAAKVTSLLHFEYSPFGKAKILTGKVGTVLGTFQHYAFSFANLNAQLGKDFARAMKAGDYTGPEVGRVIRMAMLYGLTNLVSVIANTDFTSYISHDTFGRANELVKFLTGETILEQAGVIEEPTKKEKEIAQEEAFYGKGIVGASGIVPLNDLVEIHNLGAAAGYWDLLADPDKTAGWLMGMREYKKIDDGEFAGEVGGMFSIQGERIIRRTLPALTHENRTLMSVIQAELGLYSGTTTLGLKTRDLSKKYFSKKTGPQKLALRKKAIKSKATKEQRAQQALAALALLD